MSNFYRKLLSVNKPLASITATNAIFNVTEQFNARKSNKWPTKFPVDILVVGGGAGGNGISPGTNPGIGGSGGKVTSTSTIIIPGLYSVTVGAGGPSDYSFGSIGGNSTFVGVTDPTFVKVAIGGQGAGGVGASGAGVDANYVSGIGVTSSIISTALATFSGVGEVYGGQVWFGGAGASSLGGFSPVGGGRGIGGSGAYLQPGTNRTGGGGGGWQDAFVSQTGYPYSGTTGGSGIVIIRVPDWVPAAKAAYNILTYNNGLIVGAPYSIGYTTYIFTGDGSINFY